MLSWVFHIRTVRTRVSLFQFIRVDIAVYLAVTGQGPCNHCLLYLGLHPLDVKCILFCANVDLIDVCVCVCARARIEVRRRGPSTDDEYTTAGGDGHAWFSSD